MLLGKPPRWMPRVARPRPRPHARDAWRDALIESYVEWHEECEAVETAYDRWTGAEPCDRALGYAAYHAALEREEKAAAVYQFAATRLV